MLRWLYRRYRNVFWDFIVEDFYGVIPNQIKEPSIEFLSKARGTLEPFFSIQAYNLQRRSISDPKNAQIYQGYLLSIRVLLNLITRGGIGIMDVEVPRDKEEKLDPMAGIRDFIDRGKKLNERKKPEKNTK